MKSEYSTLREKINEFEQMCKEGGIKVTHQRMEIFREIITAPAHPSAEEIYRRVRSKLPMISLDTVYRTLAVFEEHGVVVRVHVLMTGRGMMPTSTLAITSCVLSVKPYGIFTG